MQSVPFEEEFSPERYMDELDQRAAESFEEQLRHLRELRLDVSRKIAQIHEDLDLVVFYTEELLRK